MYNAELQGPQGGVKVIVWLHSRNACNHMVKALEAREKILGMHQEELARVLDAAGINFSDAVKVANDIACMRFEILEVKKALEEAHRLLTESIMEGTK